MKRCRFMINPQLPSFSTLSLSLSLSLLLLLLLLLLLRRLKSKSNPKSKMERGERKRGPKLRIYALLLVGLLLLSFVRDLSALSVTVNDVECVSEYVIYEGDTVSGNFVVVDHDIFWNSDHPGIDFTVISL